MAKIEIEHGFTGEVLFAHECEGNTLRLTVEAAVSAQVSLRDANLARANLAGANLADADLAWANFARANLAGANLAGANFADADLAGANFARANLARADVPIIAHIDAAILRAIETPGNELDMHSWHACATTHCRAGWAITLAGSAGAELEKRLGPSAAAALIYAASRPGQRVPDFFAPHEDALADLRACAAADPLPAEAAP